MTISFIWPPRIDRLTVSFKVKTLVMIYSARYQPSGVNEMMTLGYVRRLLLFVDLSRSKESETPPLHSPTGPQLLLTADRRFRQPVRSCCHTLRACFPGISVPPCFHTSAGGDSRS